MVRHIAYVSLSLSVLALAGCPSTAERSDGSTARQSAQHPHASEGPHGGDLIELGSEEYHAELVFPKHSGEDEAVTIYLLDDTAEHTVAVDATEVKLNMLRDGRGEQFTLAASPESSDAEGTSSRFTSSEEELLDLFHREEVEGELVVNIGGKQYRGDIGHHHADHGHGHTH